MELSTLSNLAEIVGVIIVIGGLWFAVIQLLHYRQQRRDMAAIELARSFQHPAFAQALRLVVWWTEHPDRATRDQIVDTLLRMHPGLAGRAADD